MKRGSENVAGARLEARSKVSQASGINLPTESVYIKSCTNCSENMMRVRKRKSSNAHVSIINSRFSGSIGTTSSDTMPVPNQ